MLEKIVNIVNDIVWSPALVVLLVAAGLYFTIRTRCVQVRRLPLMVRLLFNSGNTSEGKTISSFQAFCVALSGRVGTGNIVGVATAIALGGPGAVFWMWIIAFLGASTAFAESTLANMYKFEHDGNQRGGPSSYILHALKSPVLAMLFSILAIIGYGCLLVLVQANGVSTAFENSFSVPPLVSGICIAAVLGLVIIGGVKRIANVASIVTPFMAAIYILMALVIIAVNIKEVPAMFSLIFSSAFGANQLFSGIIGSTIAMGVKRGLFSNEAGEGGGAIVSASADVDHPAKQGLVQAFSVYVDTLLVCTATALMILCTGSFNVFDSEGNMILAGAPELGKNYVSFTQTAIDSVFNGFGSIFVTIALTFFAFTTIMAYYFYAESSFFYIFHRRKVTGGKNEKIILNIYRVLMMVLVVTGACTASDTVWKIGDIGVGLTTWINIIALLILFPKALESLKDLEKKIH